VVLVMGLPLHLVCVSSGGFLNGFLEIPAWVIDDPTTGCKAAVTRRLTSY
jgi:hypothetical protein